MYSDSNNNIRTQASLGNEFKRRYKEGENINTISLGQVVAYHPRYNTVDVVTYPRNDKLSDSYFTGGQFSAKLPIGFSGTDKEGNAYGQISPVEKGTLVVVGYIEGHKTTPIVLGIYGKPEESFDLSRSPVDSVDYNDKEQDKYIDENFTVFPSLTYESTDGRGNKAVSLPGKSFLVFDSEANDYMESVSDDGLGTDYQDLDTSYYHSGKMITPKERKAPTVLFRHQGDKLTKDGTVSDDHALLFFIDQDGTLRTSMVNKSEDFRSSFELRNDGRISLKYQNDTNSIHNSADYHELFIDDKGVGVVTNGNLVRLNEDGFGGINRDEFSDMYNELSGELERKVSKMEKTFVDENGNLTNKTSELSQSLEDIIARVSELTILDEDDVTGVVQEVLDQSNIYQSVIDKIAEDNIITGAEKVQIATMWDMIRAEYPAYVQQAEDLELDTGAYTEAYSRLEDYIVPLISNLEETTNIDGIEFREHFFDYYNAKNTLVYGIFNDVNLKVIDAAKEAGDAGLAAADARGEAISSRKEADRALGNLEDIADDDKVTPQEKGYIRSLMTSIYLEVGPNIERANEFESEEHKIDTTTYELAYDNLYELVYNEYKLFENMSETTPIDSVTFQSAFEDYYSAEEQLNSMILKTNKDILLGFQGDFEYYDTELEVAKDGISANSGYIKALGEEVDLAYAYINLTPGKIESGTSYSWYKRELDDPMGYNIVGENLFVNQTAIEGALNPNTGSTDSQVLGDLTSNYIQVKPSMDYTAGLFNNKGNNRLVVTYYDEAFNFLDGSSVASEERMFKLTTTSPPTAKYARVSSRNTADSQLQFELGDGSDYYTLSIQDIGSSVVLATEEKDRRTQTANHFKDVYEDALTHDSNFVSQVDTMIQDLQITSEDKGLLIPEYEKIQQDYEDIMDEATDQELNTTLMENRYLALSNVLDEYLADESTTITLTNRDALPKLFQDYYTAKQDVLAIIVDNTEQAKEASEDLLDEISDNAVRAEEIANNIRAAAEEILNSITLIRDMINTTNAQETEDYQILERVSEDNSILPSEIVELVPIIDSTELLHEILINQARIYGLDTESYDNSYYELISTVGKYTTIDGMKSQHDITNIDFLGLWRRYYDDRRTLMNDILLSAEDEYRLVDEQAIASRQEALRRQEDFQDYQNAIKDSSLAIERNRESIDELLHSLPYTVEITSTNGTSFKNRVVRTQLIVRVIEGQEDITDSIPAEDFLWTKVDANGEEDEEWNKRHIGIGNKIDISHSDFVNKATFFMDYMVEEDE